MASSPAPRSPTAACASARSSKLELTDEGVDAYLDIDNGYDTIPKDALAVVGNRSAVGEQYVDLQPQANKRPLPARRLARSRRRTPATPIADPDSCWTDLSDTVESVDKHGLRTTVTEIGTAFDGTGEDLQRIIDTGNSFIHDGEPELRHHHRADPRQQHRAARARSPRRRAIRTFARDLALFSGTLAGSDPDLRKVIDSGSVTATELRTFIEDNRGRPRRADQQPGHHRRGRGQAPRRGRAAAGALPVRRRGRLHRRLQVPGQRAVRRPLRA